MSAARMKHLFLSALLAATTTVAEPTQPTNGYLVGPAVDLVQVLPPAPERGTPRYDADRRTFRETRKLLSTSRRDLPAAH